MGGGRPELLLVALAPVRPEPGGRSYTGPEHRQLHSVRSSLRDEGAGQEAHQADGSTTHGRDPAAQDVCEDADDGGAEEDHAHGERAHPRCKTQKQKLRLCGTTIGLKEQAASVHP